MNKVLNITLVVLASIFLLAVSAQSLYVEEEQAHLQDLDLPARVVDEQDSFAEKETLAEINDLPLKDNPDIYLSDDPDSIVTMYLTIREGNASDNTDHTWQEVNRESKSIFDPDLPGDIAKAEAILQVGDENGPIPGELGYGEIVPNATVQIRGNTTSRMPQKSYKIELRDRAGEWRGQTTIALNKHIFEPTRVRNKLCYDLIKQIPNMVSLRTQFVHLYVKDETSDPPAETFVDYGLFTQIEQPNRRFLRNHLLDMDAQFYKANFFEFFRYPEKIRLADDPLYDEAAFSTVLEIKGNRDHSKLIQMLEDVNNLLIPIEQTFEKYFDADNYFTWMAFNLLVGNIDTQSQNFYLYSPQNSHKWYFFPWDYDGALMRLELEIVEGIPYEFWERGIGNYWGVVLHRRVLQVEEYRQMLNVRIDELMNFLTPDRIGSMLESYRAVTEEYVLRMPDFIYLHATPTQYDQIFTVIPSEVQTNYQIYLDSLELPMPFYLGTPKLVGDELQFNWEESYDFDAQDITYRFMVSRDWDFQEIIVDATTTNITLSTIDVLEPGVYFWRVIATNQDGKVQYPFDYYMDAEGYQHSGMKILYITEDGRVLEE